MRLVTFLHNGRERAGILLGDAAGVNDMVVDLAHPAMGPVLGDIAPSLPAMIEVGLLQVTARLTADAYPPDACLRLRDVTLRAPLQAPRRIFGIAYNYRDALAESGRSLPSEPFVFMKEGWTVIGPGEPVVLPAGIGGVTYESEIAAVIGTRAEAVGAERALDYVCAYGVFNDISASELIRRDGFHKGKNVPSFGPFGPYLATADEIPNPQALRVGLAVDNTILQDSSTAQMLFGVADLIAFLSRDDALEPGDVIATGTPAGIAAMRKPPAWIKAGTTMHAWVEGLGTLINPVVEGPTLG